MPSSSPDPFLSTSDESPPDRLAALAALTLSSRDPAGALAELAATAGRLFEAPGALISIGLDDGAWYRGQHGLPEGFSWDHGLEALLSHGSELAPLLPSPDFSVPNCATPGCYGVTAGTEPADADLNDAHSTPPADRPPRYYYGGVPVLSAEGRAVGAFCILDTKPRVFSRQDRDLLQALAARALDELILRVERIHAEHQWQQAQQRDQRKSEAVAWTAHEMRNPLTVIKGISTMLAADPAFPLEMRVEFLQTITRQVDRMLRLVDQSLDLSRLETGQPLELRPRPIDAVERLRQILSLFGTTHSRHKLELESDAGPHTLCVDPDRFDQVFHNLISNAVKYSPGGGAVTVSITGEPEGIRFVVADQGLGMTAEQVARLFTPYSRLHQQMAPSIRGTGLGLYFTQEIIKAHGGSIRVESVPAAGTRVHVWFRR